MRRLSLLAPILLAAACTSPADEPAPNLLVTSPERGFMSDTGFVRVTGETDASHVSINGEVVEVAADGTFDASIQLTPGIRVIETIAGDEGNTARDVRAVLSGNLVPTGQLVPDAIGAHLGPQALSVLGDVVERTVEGMDLAALLPAGAVVDEGGSCFGAKVYVLDVAHGNIEIGLSPVPGALDASVTVDDLDVLMRVDYALGCLDETATINVHADRVGFAGDIGMTVTAGTLASSLENADVTLTGFDLTSDGLAGSILDLIEGPVQDYLPGLVEGMVGDVVPPLVDEKLVELAGQTFSVPVLGHEVSIAVKPATVDMAASGITVAIDTRMVVSGDTTGRYLSSPASARAALSDAGAGMGLAVADDTLNMMFASMWGAGALEHTLPVEEGNSLGLLLGADTRNLHASIALPPTVSMDEFGAMRLMIGDAIVEGTDEAGNVTVKMAITLSTTLAAAARPDGTVKLELGEPQIWAQVLEQNLDPAIDGENVEALIDGLYGVLAATANQTLADLPLPSIAGVSMVEPTMDASGGFLVIETGLAMQ